MEAWAVGRCGASPIRDSSPHNPRDGVEVFPGNGSGCGAFMANDGTRGTLGQLVGGTVVGQVADFSRQRTSVPPSGFTRRPARSAPTVWGRLVKYFGTDPCAQLVYTVQFTPVLVFAMA